MTMITQFEEKGKIFTNVISKKPISVTIMTTMGRVQGRIHIRPEDRLKDELNRTDTFIALTDATIYDLQGKLVVSCKFMSLNCSNVIWVVPDDEVVEKPGV
jgi:hypothetical protein